MTKFYDKFDSFLSFLNIRCRNIFILDETPLHYYNPYKQYYISSKSSYCVLEVNCTVTFYRNITNGNVKFIPLKQFLCKKSKCEDIIDGILVYSDKNHITLEYSLSKKYYFYNILRSKFNGFKWNSNYFISECVITRDEFYKEFYNNI